MKDLTKLLNGDLRDYRPVPFWSWNDDLQPEELVRQIDEMKEKGIGGFFMHARGGLKTEYLGEDWFLGKYEDGNRDFYYVLNDDRLFEEAKMYLISEKDLTQNKLLHLTFKKAN